MSRLTKQNSTLRSVILGKAALKTKLAALSGMELPSETFLSELLSSDEHPNLKTKAAELLARARQRREIKSILAAETERLKGSLPRPQVEQKPTEGSTSSPVEHHIASEAPKTARKPEHDNFTKRLSAPENRIPEETPTAAGLEPETPKSAEPRPIYKGLPKGSFLTADEGNRLAQLFRVADDPTRTELQRSGARSQLECTCTMPDAARSTFALFLLNLLAWSQRHPDVETRFIPYEQPRQPEITDDGFAYMTATQLVHIGEAERNRPREEIVSRVLQGGMWEGLPVIEG